MNRIARLALWIAGGLLAAPVQTAEPQDLVVTLDRTAGKAVVLLNSKETSDPLMALSRLHREGVPDKPILLLVNPKTPIDEISNMLGVMVKAQTATPRIFVLSQDKRSMHELIFGCISFSSIDFTKLPPKPGASCSN